MNRFEENLREREEWSSVGNHLGQTSGKPIQLAVKTKRRVEVIPYNTETEDIEPQVIEISSKPIPIRLNFRTFSSPLNIEQTLHSGKDCFKFNMIKKYKLF